MKDRPALNESESLARNQLVALAEAMLVRELSFFEGAVQILALKQSVGGIADHDADFEAFTVIESESDHLPLKAQQHLWEPAALAKLEHAFVQTEEWASSFAPAACSRLISRFRTQS